MITVNVCETWFSREPLCTSCLAKGCYVCMVWQSGGDSPLYIASKEGHVNMVKALLRAGVDVNETTVRDDEQDAYR